MKIKNNDPRPKFTGFYNKKKIACNSLLKWRLKIKERTSLRLNCLLWLFYGGEEKRENVKSTDFWLGKCF